MEMTYLYFRYVCFLILSHSMKENISESQTMTHVFYLGENSNLKFSYNT